MLVALHATQEEFYLPVQDALVRAIQMLGYEVYLWYHRRDLPKRCDYLIWWGCNIQHDLLCAGRRTKGKIIYLERGWTIDRNTCCQLDWKGTGGLCSWAQHGVQFESAGPLSVKKEGDLLVILRYERHDGRPVDNVHALSPFFPDNLSWLQHLRAGSVLPIRLRPHPETRASRNAPLQHYARLNRWTWDQSPDFQTAIAGAKAVAVLDSTAGVWAMELGLPVLCFGIQVYRHERIVYCLNNSVDRTQTATSELARGECSLDTGGIAVMLRKIRAKQWYAKDEHTFPERLHTEFGL